MKVNIENAKQIVFKYCLDDALKPQYNGMSAYEFAYLVLKAGLGKEIDYNSGEVLEALNATGSKAQ